MNDNHDAHARSGGIDIEKVGLDVIEKIVLEVTRHLCQTYAEPYSQSWEYACGCAENQLGLIDGGQVFVRVTQFLRAIRRERSSPFAFIDARCPKCAKQILPVELHLIMSTRHARQNDMKNMIAECTGLVGGAGTSTACQTAAMHLAQAMESVQPIARVDAGATQIRSMTLH